jgi:hypothetical protein
MFNLIFARTNKFFNIRLKYMLIVLIQFFFFTIHNRFKWKLIFNSSWIKILFLIKIISLHVKFHYIEHLRNQ